VSLIGLSGAILAFILLLTGVDTCLEQETNNKPDMSKQIAANKFKEFFII